jgi:hypothetical protein
VTRLGRGADHSPLVPTLKMSGAVPPLPRTLSWLVEGFRPTLCNFVERHVLPVPLGQAYSWGCTAGIEMSVQLCLYFNWILVAEALSLVFRCGHLQVFLHSHLTLVQSCCRFLFFHWSDQGLKIGFSAYLLAYEALEKVTR